MSRAKLRKSKILDIRRILLISAILTMVGLLFGTIFVQQGFSQGRQLIFQEVRQWQVAADEIGIKC